MRPLLTCVPAAAQSSEAIKVDKEALEFQKGALLYVVRGMA